ncbi:hypothetical protein [Streptomyces sp. YU58]|uniref:hypothetical protein n=1 Tax=Streptomyces sp. SX92 TaxID=3158972 RepID=UPI0027B9C108|nr:hypothetical protein [Streptomyces coralus]WLW58736.1 hypothetical protein QU709_40610 [Streptomyces coralus]
MLVPDDPVFYAKFQSLEEPLLRHLYRLHHGGTDPDDEQVISDAYDSWVQVLLKLPLWARWHTEDAPVVPAPAEPPPRYTLYSVRGEQLTSLYPIEVTAADLGHLTACLDLFVDTHAEPPDGEERLTDVFRRVMEVLLLSPPPGLLNLLRCVVASGGAVSVTLPTEHESAYRRFCEEVVTILSSGDTFAFSSHRAMYL